MPEEAAILEGSVILTADGARRLEEQLERLRSVERKEVADRIREAKAFGDLSENNEYEVAKEQQAFVEGRIIDLKRILGSASIVEQDDVPTDQIGVGSHVEVQDLEFKEKWRFQMVGPVEANGDDKISYESPVGQGLIGSKVGQTVSVNVPAGSWRAESAARRSPGGRLSAPRGIFGSAWIASPHSATVRCGMRACFCQSAHISPDLANRG
jgi:transcription elongation factor GreA